MSVYLVAHKSSLLQDLRDKFATKRVFGVGHGASPKETRCHLQGAENQTQVVQVFRMSGRQRVLLIATRDLEANIVRRLERTRAHGNFAAHVDGACAVIRKLQLYMTKRPIDARHYFVYKAFRVRGWVIEPHTQRFHYAVVLTMFI